MTGQMGCLWVVRLLLLWVLVLGVVMASALITSPGGLTSGGAAGGAIFLGFLFVAVVIVMYMGKMSFSDLFAPHPFRAPQARAGRLVIHCSAVRLFGVGLVAMLFIGPMLIPILISAALKGVPYVGLALSALVAGAVVYWRGRAIVVDADTVALTRFFRIRASCNRAEVAGLRYDLVSRSSPFRNDQFKEVVRLVNSKGLIETTSEGLALHSLLTIPLVLFSDREVGWLSTYLSVPVTRYGAAHSPTS